MITKKKDDFLQCSRNITALLEKEKDTQNRFCDWCEKYGASSSTLRDTLLYRYRNLSPWKLIGIDKLVRDFNPNYKDDVLNYYETVEKRMEFYRYMKERGGMSRTTCWSRFNRGDFKPWELIGLDKLANEFLQSIINNQ